MSHVVSQISTVGLCQCGNWFIKPQRANNHISIGLRWLSAILQYLHSWRTWDTTFLQETIDILQAGVVPQLKPGCEIKIFIV